jgi:hypothetical protein
MPEKSLIQPYGPLRSIGPEIWARDGDWNGTVFGRRLTLCRLADGRLVVHNAFRLREEDYAELASLGKVAYILVPNRFHASEAADFQRRFPEAEIIASPAAKRTLRKTKARVASWLPEGWQPRGEMPVFAISGLRGLGEFVFLHRASRSLIVTDLVFHMLEVKRATDRSFLRLNDIYGKFGPSRVFKLLFTRDEAAMLASVVPVLREEFDRVVMNHGVILESGGKAALRRGFLHRFPSAARVFDEAGV